MAQAGDGPIDDSAVRARAAGELDTTFLVEASAGTGKTRLLVDRLMSIIAGGRADLRQVVAITFTEKAAGELKLRLRRSLEEVVAQERGEIRERCLRALADLPLAPVTTIHSFASLLLRERPIEAELDPDSRVADELGSRMLLAEAWAEWQEEAFSRPDPDLARALALGLDPPKLRQAVELLVRNRDILEEFVLAPGESPPGGESDPDDRPGLSGDREVAEGGKGVAGGGGEPVDPDVFLALEFLPALREFMRELPALLPRCSDPADHGLRQMEELSRRWKALTDFSPESIDRWLGHSPLPAPRGDRRHWRPPEALASYKEELKRLRELEERYLSLRRHQVLARLLSRLAEFLLAYERKRRERSILDFQDLLLRARNLLRDNREVRRYFQERFRYLLIDEFQDTDPLQAEIAFFLAEDSPAADDWRRVRLVPGKLFLVGDPKQSIYRFRRADIEIYELAREAILRQEAGRGEVLMLSRNFRSAGGVVSWVNYAFEKLIRPAEGEKIQPEYHPLTPSEKTAGLPGEAILLTPSSGRREELGEKAGIDDLVSLEAQLVAGAMEALLRGKVPVRGGHDSSPRPVRLADMALLLPVYIHVERFEEELTRRGIPYRLLGGKSFYQRVETHALVSLLRAVENPHDLASVVAALKSPAFGVSDEDLLLAASRGQLDPLRCVVRGGALTHACETLARFHLLRNELPLALLLERLLRETHLLSLALLMPQGEQRVANLLKIVETARSLDRGGTVSFRRFVRELSQLVDEEASEAEPAALEEGEDAVRILTIHRAKGLEFPVVFLADLTSGGPARRHGRWPDVVVHRGRGEFAWGLGPKLTTLGYRELREYEDRCALAEANRLLYVAATRARNYLYLVHPQPAEAKGYLALLAPVLGRPGEFAPGAELEPGEAGAMKGETADSGERPRGESVAGIRVEDETAHPPPPRERSWGRFSLPSPAPGRDPVDRKKRAEELALREDRWRRELARVKGMAREGVSILHPSRIDEEEFAPDETAPAPSGAGRDRGALVGELVHLALARAFELGEDDLRKFLGGRAEGTGLTADESERARVLLERALASSLMARARKAGRVLTEVPFMRLLGDEGPNTFVEGRIDLLFAEEDRLILVDYKTDAVRGPALRERASGYYAALAEYRRSAEILTRRPVSAYLFFIEPGELISLEDIEPR